MEILLVSPVARGANSAKTLPIIVVLVFQGSIRQGPTHVQHVLELPITALPATQPQIALHVTQVILFN